MIVSDPRFRPWIESRIGVALADDAVFIGQIKEGSVCCVIAFSHYLGHDIDVSLAAEPGSSRKLLAVFEQYVFGQLGCCRVTARIRASNRRSQKLAERLGFKREGILRLGYEDEDAFIYGLLKSEYIYGKRRRQTACGS